MARPSAKKNAPTPVRRQSTRDSSPSQSSRLDFGSRTDIGCVRKHNEDSLIVSPPLFAVADGMGGHAAGEVASEIAVNTLALHAPEQLDAEALGAAVVAANTEVIAGAHDGRGREGMGTTMTAAMIEGERLIIAQVGDSRAYLLSQDKLQQLTRDHSLMADMIDAGQLTEEEARNHPNRSVITRALGSDTNMLADLYEINVRAGDRLLLCSDGLSTMLTDDMIQDILGKNPDPQRCANMLVNEAISAGGHDNVTVIVVDISGLSEVREKKVSRKATRSVIAIILAFVAVMGAAAFGFNQYVQNSFYLTAEEGQVAVYRGLPGSLFGAQSGSLDYVSDIAVADLQPGVANRLDEGIRVDSLEAAEDLLDEYRATAKKEGVPGASNGSQESGDPQASGALPGSETGTGTEPEAETGNGAS